jgi:general secretion pathway protein A
MYDHYFGLNETPFSIAVDPRYLFMSARHRDALAHLLYGVGTGGGFILLTGEVGTGKTTVIRCLLERLPENTDLAIILNPALNSVELLATVCDELGIVYDTDETSLKKYTDLLHTFLLDNYARNRKTVLLIDEAQHLKFDVLEQIRLLTNLETNTQKLLQIVLVGQPELRTLLNKPELRQLAQRITARYQLKPLNLAETHDYINHRLQVAGLPMSSQLFPKAVIKHVHKISRGVPRLINVLCDRSLLGAYAKNRPTVDRAILKQAVTEVMGEKDETLMFLNIKKPKLLFASLAFFIFFSIVLTTIGATLYFRSLSENNEPGGAKERESLVADRIPSLSEAGEKGRKVSSLDMDEVGATTFFVNLQQAFSELAQALDVEDIDCSDLRSSHYRCEKHIATSWRDLMVFNRPTVITIISPAKLIRYAIILFISDTEATLYSGGEFHSVKLESLGKLWTGDFVFVWKPPVHYNGRISKGDSGPMVDWLATQFSRIDGQRGKLTDSLFNESLKKRVEIFQSDHRLTVDGVVGLKTLLVLNEQLGVAQILRQPTRKENVESISSPEDEG